VEYRLEALLDRCLSELKQGRDLEEILGDRPDAADELRPLLATAAWAALHVPVHRHAQVHKRAVMAFAEDRRRLVESVDGYVNEVRAGVDLEQITSRAPQSLAGIVLAAWRMKNTAVPARSPERIAADRARVVAYAAERRGTKRRRAALRVQVRAGLAGLAHGLLPRPTFARRMRSATASGLATLVLAAGVVGVNTAAADSLPGQPFYGMKRFGEAAQLFLASDETREALEVEFSARRLEEMRLLVEQGRAVPAELTAEWLDSHAHAWDQIQRLPWDQRELLAEMLLASLESPSAGITDARSLELAAALRESLGLNTPESEPRMPLAGQPVDRNSVLPADESAPGADPSEEASAPEPDAQDPPAVAAPAPAPVVVAPPAVGPEPADNDAGDEQDDPAAPPVEEPADSPEPRRPAFGVPPVSPDPETPPEGGASGP
jgi:hypothetical protein